MKKSFFPIVLCLTAPWLARASDDNIRVSNLYDSSSAYWNVSSSEARQDLFESMSRDLAIAISHKNLAPGETLGINGFEIGLDTTAAFVGTVPRCSPDDAVATCQKELDRTDAWRVMDADHRLTFGNALVIPTLRIRKGLPFSTEVGTDLSYLSFSHQTAFSAYGRLALHEGMWDRTWRVIPDVALTFAGTRFLGNEQLNLSLVEWNLTVGWTVPVGGLRDSYVGTFSPFFGAGRMYITSIPRGPLPDKLEYLTGRTGLQSNEVIPEEGSGVREVSYAGTTDDPTDFHPWKVNVGMRITSGMFRMVSLLEFAHNAQTDGWDRPSVTVGIGFIY